MSSLGSREGGHNPQLLHRRALNRSSRSCGLRRPVSFIFLQADNSNIYSLFCARQVYCVEKSPDACLSNTIDSWLGEEHCRPKESSNIELDNVDRKEQIPAKLRVLNPKRSIIRWLISGWFNCILPHSYVNLAEPYLADEETASPGEGWQLCQIVPIPGATIPNAWLANAHGQSGVKTNKFKQI